MKDMCWRFAQWLGAASVSIVFAASAHANCTVKPATSASFGTSTSFVVKNTAQRTSTPNSGLACTGSLLSLLSTGNYINATITSLNNGRMAATNGDKVPYAIFADSAYSIQLNPGTTYDYFSPQLIDLLGIFGGPEVSLPQYFQTATGSNVAAGVYTDTLIIDWNWHVCTGIGLLGICLGWNNGSATSTFTVSLTVTNDCAINAPNVSFGSAPTISGFNPVNGSLSMICTKGMTYTVGLSNGMNPAANGRRQMANGAHRLQYDIFSAGNTVWGTAENRVASAEAADGLSSQLFPYTARIYADQATPPLGTYMDTVIVDVRY
jgi:spore coat protein U-like protein